MARKVAPGGPCARNNKEEEQQQPKKQATPSQVRANHEKQKLASRSGGRGIGLQEERASKGTRDGDTNKQTFKKDKLAASEKSAQTSGDSISASTRGADLDKNLATLSSQALEIKAEIHRALERQARFHGDENLKDSVDELRNSIMVLTQANEKADDEQQVESLAARTVSGAAGQEGAREEDGAVSVGAEVGEEHRSIEVSIEQPQVDSEGEKANTANQESGGAQSTSGELKGRTESDDKRASESGLSASGNCFEPLSARLDPRTKFLALRSSLEHHFLNSPELLEPICNKLIQLADQNDSLALCNEQSRQEIAKLTSIKSKLGELCRELQKSNNEIRIESLDLIRAEQNKAKEQTGRIQSTLSGVMKLFDENQQRNLALKQENIELQARLRSLLEHCGQWEKCVETALKQREIENKLIKTEMARLSFIRNEEKGRFDKEKQGLLQALTTMKAHQSKIEEKEAKLRSDLNQYASKYDECQEIIHKGLAKFQLESKRMMKQIEKSRQDYIQLLGKYEASNKKIKTLLEEKQNWAQSVSATNKKVDTLDRLCRSLKAENDKLRGKLSLPAETHSLDLRKPGAA